MSAIAWQDRLSIFLPQMRNFAERSASTPNFPTMHHFDHLKDDQLLLLHTVEDEVFGLWARGADGEEIIVTSDTLAELYSAIGQALGLSNPLETERNHYRAQVEAVADWAEANLDADADGRGELEEILGEYWEGAQ